jgi:hypothetical protein
MGIAWKSPLALFHRLPQKFVLLRAGGIQYIPRVSPKACAFLLYSTVLDEPYFDVEESDKQYIFIDLK